MLMSLAVVFFGMQLMMVGPLKGRLDGIQTRLDLTDQNMKQLVGTQDGVRNANHLLADLEVQTQKIDEVKNTLRQMDGLYQQVEQEARNAEHAVAQLNQIQSLHQQIIASADETETAAVEIAQLEALRRQIISGTQRTEVADNSLDGMLALQKRVIAASNGYEAASTSIANLADLTQRLAASDQDLKVAAARFDQFLDLQHRVIAAADGHDKADSSLRTLVAMKETLAGPALQLDAAQENLDRIAELHGMLDSQSVQVANAISNLELMDDFHNEVSNHVLTLTRLRRTLMDLAMLETTVGKVASVIAPLTEISNLRRLNEDEVREAARHILDQRSTRLSQHAPMVSAETAEADSNEEAGDGDLVPLPSDARLQ